MAQRGHRPQRRLVVGGEDGDEQAAPREQSERSPGESGQRQPAVRLGDGEDGQRLRRVDRERIGPVPDRLGGEEVDGIPEAGQVHHHRGGGTHRPLEGTADADPGVGVDPRVEQDDGAAPGRSILLAHHEFARARSGRPMDAPQVVAVAVFADRLVVLAVQRHHERNLTLGAHPRARRSIAAERVDAGQDEDLGRLAGLDESLAEPERIAQLHGERPEQVTAAQWWADGIRESAAFARAQRAEQHPRSFPEDVVELFLGEHERG